MGTCFEIGVPAFFTLVLVVLRQVLIEPEHVPTLYYPSMPISPTDPYWTTTTIDFLTVDEEPYQSIGYFPADDENLATVMNTVHESVLRMLPAGRTLDLIPISSEAQMIEQVNNASSRLFAVVQFNEKLPSANTTGPLNLGYRLRLAADLPSTTQNKNWMTKFNFPQFERPRPRNWNDIPYFSPNSFGNGQSIWDSALPNGFLQIQAAVDQSITKYYSPNRSYPQITPRVTSYPFPAFEDDAFFGIISGLFPFILVLSFLYTVMSITRQLIHEKETRMKEAMRMMGLPNWVNWTAWFLKDFSFLLISVIIMLVLFSGGEVLRNSSNVLLLVLLLLFALNVISFSYMMSSFFSSANTGAICALFLWFVAYEPYALTAPDYDDLTYEEKASMCLLGPSCVAIASRIIAQFESRGDGIQFDNLYENPADNDTFTMGAALGFLLFDAILYFVVCLYIENVFPGQYGNPKHPLFFLDVGYWCGRKHIQQELTAGVDSSSKYKEDMELIGDKPVGVSLSNVRKVWNTPAGDKIAVQGLTLDIVQDEVTVLLGQNGAGKTTTMNMMVGMYPPSSGTCAINGHDIVKDTKAARDSLGLCPQFDILFDDLTVKEHLYFFSRLKGCTDHKAIQSDIDTFIADVDLAEKADVRSKHLSGGQKRALSVAAGFIGGSKIIILDEPTSGMDPYKRRRTWDLIDKHKLGRTVLLTTHFMDEADLLGDRIAVMREGELRCAGSSLFLKDRFGCGYHMTVQKGSGAMTQPIKTVVESHIPEAVLEQDLGQALIFQLPKSSSPMFSAMFAELERRSSELNIESCGASVTTMEDVFLKLNKSSEIDLSKAVQHKESSRSEDEVLIPTNFDERYELISGVGLLYMQLHAMLLKKLLTLKRNKRMFIQQALIPIIFVLLAVIGAKYATGTESSEDCRIFDTSDFEESASYVSAQNNWGYNVGTPLPQPNSSSVIGEMLSMTNTFLSTSPTTATLGYSQVPNVTTTLLYEANNFQQTQFYRRHPASYSYGPGAIWLDQSCRVRSNGVYVAESLMLLANTTYVLFHFPPDVGDNLDQLDTVSFQANVTNIEGDRSANGFGSISLEVLIGDMADGTPGTIECTTIGGNVSSVAVMITTDASTAYQPTEVFAEALFNRQMFHSAPESLNYLGNIIARQATGNPEMTIAAANCPLPKSNEKLINDNDSDTSLTFGLGINLALGLSLFLASCTLFPVTERATLAKHIQFVSGVDARMYWFGQFLSDALVGLFMTAGVLILLSAFNIEQYTDAYGELLLVMLLFIWAALPLTYCLTFWFSKSATAYALSAVLFWMLSIAMIVTMYILPLLDNRKYVREGLTDSLRHIFYLNPVYASVQAFVDIYDNYQYLQICSVQSAFCDFAEIKPRTNYLAMDGLGIGLICVYLFFEGILYAAILLIIEKGSARSFLSKASKNTPVEFEDTDVTTERLRVNANPQEAVVCQGLGKTYRGKVNKVAVKNVSFGVPSGEIFGLLGVNGAGKSTTFKMLTGEVGISRGGAKINGHDIAKNMVAARRSIGYCPQYDGLIPFMTGKELLYMFGRLRGIPKSNLADVVNRSIAFLELGEHCNRLAGTYSGGNKRKLSTAIALIGKPTVLFLDEPTTGMDPSARRSLWDSLIKTAKSGKSIVLTSHSMEECEALCTKLAVMVNGEFKCFGTSQHLKAKFAKGYSLIVRVKDISNNEFITFIQGKLPVVVMAQHDNQIDFRITDGTVPLSTAFNILESQEVQQKLDDYNLSQTSLEQVFLGFASQQQDDDNDVHSQQTQHSVQNPKPFHVV